MLKTTTITFLAVAQQCIANATKKVITKIFKFKAKKLTTKKTADILLSNKSFVSDCYYSY